MDELSPRVALSFPNDEISPTGIPPHVSIQRDLVNAEAPAPDGQFQRWMVNGQLRRVPQNFNFDTALSTQTLFQLYCLGDRNTHIGPYRMLESTDLPDLSQKKRLSDMFALLRPVETALKRQKQWQVNPTIEQVNEMWELGSQIIEVDGTTPQGRKRRLKQIAWSTHLRE